MYHDKNILLKRLTILLPDKTMTLPDKVILRKSLIKICSDNTMNQYSSDWLITDRVILEYYSVEVKQDK